MEPIVHELEQGTQEWLEFRKQKIGASDAPVIMGVAPKEWKKTPYKLWQLKLGLIEEPPMNFAMIKGHQAEPRVRQRMELMLSCSLSPAVLSHPKYPWMIASMDGYNAEKRIGLEIKKVKREYVELARQGVVPECYYPQLQQQLAVSGLDQIYYVSDCDEGDVILQVPRDEDYIEELIKKEEEFRQCVLEERPPLSDDEIETIAESASLAEELEEIWCQLDPLLQKEKELKAKLSSREVEGTFGGVIVRYSSRVGSVQYDRIPELAGVDLDQYRGPPGGTWQVARARRRASV